MDVLKPLLGSSSRSEQAIRALSHLFLGYAGRPLDLLYSRIGGLNGRFFPRGWGNLGIVNLKEDIDLIKEWPPQRMKVDWKLLQQGTWEGVPYRLYEGSYKTPCVNRIYDALPKESRVGRVQLLLPAAGWGSSSGAPIFRHPHTSAAVLHLAATGDHGFSRRLRLGGPLLQQGVGQLVHESPYYGARRPPDQRGSKLCAVSDLLALGWATIYESLCLLDWLEEEGVQQRGICGLSMGGVHAAMTAGLYPRPLAITPLLTPRSAAVAYCDGALAPLMAWHALLKERDLADNEVEQLVAAASRPVSLLHKARYVRLQQLQENLDMIDESMQHHQRSHPHATAQQPRQQAWANQAMPAGQRTAALTSVAEAAAAEQGVAVSHRGCHRADHGDHVQLQHGQRGIGMQCPAEVLCEGSGTPEGKALDAVSRPNTVSTAKAMHATEACQVSKDCHGREITPSASHLVTFANTAYDISNNISSSSSSSNSNCNSTDSSNNVSVIRNNNNGEDGVQCSAQQVVCIYEQDYRAQQACRSPIQHSQRDGCNTLSWRREVWRRCGSNDATRHVPDMLAEAHPWEADGVSSHGTPYVETFTRLRHVLETYTDVTRYPRPVRPDAAVLVAARHDGYVDLASVKALQEHWPGSELRLVSGGHVSAFLMHQDAFRAALRDSLARLATHDHTSSSA